MSYDLAIWRSKRPLTTHEAGRILASLGNDVPTGIAPDRRVAAFYKKLSARYPSLDAANKVRAARSPWTAALDVTKSHVLIPIAFSRVKAVLPEVMELALSVGLVCFDPQGPRVTQAVPTGTARRSVFQTEDGSVTLAPSTATLKKQLSALRAPQNSFAILERGPQRYIQALVNAKNKWLLEYRDGSADKHFRASKPALQDVVRAFAGFAEDGLAWKDALAWKKVKV